MTWLAATLLAIAAPTAELEGPSEVIIVYGEERVRVAREKVISDLESLGYDELVEKDGRLVLRHHKNWKGKVVLYDDGFLKFKRQTPESTMPDTFFKEASPLVGWVPCIVVPTACVKVGGWIVSKRKFSAVETKATRAVAADLMALGERHSDLGTQRKVEGLQAQLEALWASGTPFEDGPTLPTLDARRAYLLRYWASRTETTWGNRTREPVEAFLRAIVQASEHPVTNAELAEINADREGLPQLKL